MLILARKVGESIVIDGRIVVTIVGVKGNPRNPKNGEIVLGITAPDEVKVWRQELLALETSATKGRKAATKVQVKLDGHFFACGDCPPCTGGRPDQCIYRVKMTP